MRRPNSWRPRPHAGGRGGHPELGLVSRSNLYRRSGRALDRSIAPRTSRRAPRRAMTAVRRGRPGGPPAIAELSAASRRRRSAWPRSTAAWRAAARRGELQPGVEGEPGEQDAEQGMHEAVLRGGDDLRPSIGDGEADVDGGDHDQPERVHRRAVQPPERQGGRRLQQPDDDPSQHRGAERGRRSERHGWPPGGSWRAEPPRRGRGTHGYQPRVFCTAVTTSPMARLD